MPQHITPLSTRPIELSVTNDNVPDFSNGKIDAALASNSKDGASELHSPPNTFQTDRENVVRAESSDQRSYGSASLPTSTSIQSQSLNTTEAWKARQNPTTISRCMTRRVKLILGSVLSVDHPVPSAIQNSVESRYRNDLENGSEEFTHMRYTAATCDPDDFTLKNGFNLRPAMYNRHTELLIGITYVSENKTLFCRSLHGIMQNIRDITTLRKSEFWDKAGPAWQKIVVCFLFDGIDPCDKDVLDVLATIGLYQDGVMKKEVGGKETVAHIFEYTTQLVITPKETLIRPRDDNPMSFPPVQMMFCLKQRNSRKINSHRWFYNAFARILNPEICAVVDVGTRPDKNALLNLWMGFYNNRDLGGACGVIYPETERGWWKWLNPLTAAQLFEYKISSGLDKPLESFCGCLTVLPGAFSAYRFRAIYGRPLEQYFHGDPTLLARLGRRGIENNTVMRQNYFLAEDRILAFEVVNKVNAKWHTAIIPEAQAGTDVPENMVDFIKQRRRWLNGAYAATVYSIIYFPRIYRSRHNMFRMVLLHLQLIYNLVSFALMWFNLAAFLLMLFVVTDLNGSPPEDAAINAWPFGKMTPYFNVILQTVYLGVIVFQFILALGSRPDGQARAYVTSFVMFGIIQLYFIANVAYLAKVIISGRSGTSNGSSYAYISTFYADIGELTVLITCVCVFGSYYLAALLNLDIKHMFLGYPQYLLVQGSYTNILNVYAFSNVHDTSWGIKIKSEGAGSLPSAQAHRDTAGGGFVEEVDRVQADVDKQFEGVVRRALTPHSPLPHPYEVTAEDTSKNFRVKLVAVYMFSNIFLCVMVMNDSFDKLKFLGDSRQHKIWYFRIWMWATSACFAFRFIGFVLHRIQRLLFCRFARR